MDLSAYLSRIGLAERPSANSCGLTNLQQAHRRAIPFENLDIPLGRGINIAPDAVFTKLVEARRGGYCFEHNSLFLAALIALGFTARPLLARVWLGANGIPPRTHTFSLVTIGETEFLADAGFGGSDVPPMPLYDGAEVQAGGVLYRLDRVPTHGWMLTRNGQQQYSFTEDPVFAADLEMANHWVSTAPASRFVCNIILSIVGDEGLTSLTNRQLSWPGGSDDLSDPGTFGDTLTRRFGITLSDDEISQLFGRSCT